MKSNVPAAAAAWERGRPRPPRCSAGVPPVAVLRSPIRYRRDAQCHLLLLRCTGSVEAGLAALPEGLVARLRVGGGYG